VTLRYLLDRSILSSPIARQPDSEILKRLDKHGHQCATAAPVWHELIYGCRRLSPGKRRVGLETYLREVVGASFPILPYEEAAAAWHGSERARLEKAGTPAPFVDGQIASIAHVNGLILVTVNTHDFALFDGIEVENWSKRRRSARRSS
jgi:tRNA(fMet)-specific endonuclease VapC